MFAPDVKLRISIPATRKSSKNKAPFGYLRVLSSSKPLFAKELDEIIYVPEIKNKHEEDRVVFVKKAVLLPKWLPFESNWMRSFRNLEKAITPLT